MNDPMIQFLLSGRGHVYYALLGALAIILAVLFGILKAQWLTLAAVFVGGSFADAWAHGYMH